MTAQEFIKGCEHDGSYIPVGEVLRLMNEYARLMCDKQKKICAEVYDYNTESVTDIVQIYAEIINASCPEELK